MQVDGPPVPSDHRSRSSTYSAVFIFPHQSSSRSITVAASPHTLAPFVCAWLVIRAQSRAQPCRWGLRSAVCLSACCLADPPGAHISPTKETAQMSPRRRERAPGGKGTQPEAVTGSRCREGGQSFVPPRQCQRQNGLYLHRSRIILSSVALKPALGRAFPGFSEGWREEGRHIPGALCPCSFLPHVTRRAPSWDSPHDLAGSSDEQVYRRGNHTSR